jgi:hypothetical protein
MLRDSDKAVLIQRQYYRDTATRVYDSFDCLAEWAAHLMLIPAEQHSASSWLHPLLTSSGVIVCALKEMD